MHSRARSDADELSNEAPRRVSSRLLSELWLALARHGIPPRELLGDLPIAVDAKGLVRAPVQWDHFNLFLRRLERRIGGPQGLERCGEWLGRPRRPTAFRGVVALATSPLSLYRAVAIWAAPRAMAGVVVELTPVSPNHLTIDVRVPEVLGDCSPVLHLTAGMFRTLPRLLGMPDAVVESHVESGGARYEVTVPSSRTLLARMRRRLRSMLTPGTMLSQLEERQLELNERLTRLARDHAALAASESRLRALLDASLDVLCELDEHGRIDFASASVQELTGYSPEQVVGSHYRLWIPKPLHALVDPRFASLRSAPLGAALERQTIELHTAEGRCIEVEVALRSHLGRDGHWRAVASLRAVGASARRSVHGATGAPTRAPASPTRRARADSTARASAVATMRAKRTGDAGSVALSHVLSDGLSDARTAAMRIGSASEGEGRLVESTRRMSRIVETVLLEDREGAASPQWHETRKLIERSSEGWSERLGSSGLALLVDVARAPVEIHGPEPVLDACVGALLDWGIERARLRTAPGSDAVRIELRIARLASASWPDSAPAAIPAAARGSAFEARTGAAVEIAVRVGWSAADGPPVAATSASSDAALALGLAADAACSLGGVCGEPAIEGDGEVCAIRLPQPEGAGSRCANGDA